MDALELHVSLPTETAHQLKHSGPGQGSLLPSPERLASDPPAPRVPLQCLSGRYERNVPHAGLASHCHLGAYVSGMRLPPEYLGEVVDELRRRHQASRPAGEEKALEGRIERWRRLFVLDEISEDRYRSEVRPLKQLLDEAQQPPEILDVERAVLYLRDVGALWAESPRKQQREFVHEVFERIVVTGPQLTATTPKPAYAPLFAIDRKERFGGKMGLVWLPGQDSNLQPSG